MKKKQNPAAYAAAFGIGLLMFAGICISRDIGSQMAADAVKTLSDASLLPAVLFSGLGGLVFASNYGAFRIFAFSTKSLFSHIFGRRQFFERYRDYYEYDLDKNKEKARVGFIFWPGMVFLLLAVSFSLLYSNMAQISI